MTQQHPVSVERPHAKPKRGMPPEGTLFRLAWLLAASGALLLVVIVAVVPSFGQVPNFFRNLLTGGQPATVRQVAEKDVLALDTSMMAIYDQALAGYKQNMRDQVPIILALATKSGGNLILYRPGERPLEAAPMPIAYQLSKSVAHSSLATYQLLAPHLGNPSDRSWHGPMRVYRQQCQSALDGLHALDFSAEDKGTLRAILEHTLAFHDACLSKGTFTYEDLENYTEGLRAHLPKAMWISLRAQIPHWFTVLENWKKLLGKDWDRTYAVTSCLYVMRQNNILFTILAQFMGQEAIGDRLLLFESTDFTPAPETMLDLLARIVSDRALGKVFFKDYYLMDAELLGGGARAVIADEATRRGMTPLIPTQAPFHSHEWPWRTDPRSGIGPAKLEEIK